MSEDKDFQELSPEEKLVFFYKNSVAALQQITGDGWNTLSLVNELDLPYHVFNWCRLIVEETRELLNLINEIMEGKEPQVFEDLTAERKLLALRSELSAKFETWIYYGTWLHNWLEERAALNLPSELSDWCKMAVGSVREIQSVMTASSKISPKHLEQQYNPVHRVNVEGWHHEKERFPILHQYETYSSALMETAQRLGLSLLDKVEMDDVSPPSGYVVFKTPIRRARTRIQSNSSRQSYGDFVLTLYWRTNDRYQTWQGYSCITKSLVEVVRVLYDWLVNQWDLKRVQQEYLWSRQAIIDSSLQLTWLPKHLKAKGGFLSPLVSTQDVYESDSNPGGRLILETLQGAKETEQEVVQAENQVVSVMNQPAIYTSWPEEQKENEESTKNGTLEWSENGITYTIHYFGMDIDTREIIKIAESIRWVVY